MPAAKIFKVFVSSTYDDLREERGVVQRALLQLNCLPVGMELFPAADEETWEFIKSQVDDADYYVVVVAGRYGSLASDGNSFTEKEYDYALSRGKPAIGFVHGRPGSIPLEKTEQTEVGRNKLRAFLEKVKRRPVRQFDTPHELGLEVTTSFVRLIRDRPAIGYVRTNESVDYKRYAELLEENNELKERLKVADETAEVAFAAERRPIKLTLVIKKQPAEVNSTLGEAFEVLAEAAIQAHFEHDVLSLAATLLANRKRIEGASPRFHEDGVWQLRRELTLFGLVEIVPATRNYYDPIDQATRSNSVNIWRLTDYGRRQLRIRTQN
jgi:hypothetical protein